MVSPSGMNFFDGQCGILSLNRWVWEKVILKASYWRQREVFIKHIPSFKSFPTVHFCCFVVVYLVFIQDLTL